MKTIILLILISLAIQHAAGMGIGISPSEITIGSALKGADYQRSITIFNSGFEPLNYSLGASGDVEEWVKFYLLEDMNTEINTIIIPGNEKANIVAKFLIPADTPNGNYSGDIDVLTIPDIKPDGSGQSLIVGASTNVQIIVTGDQIIDGEVTSILIEDTEPNFPLKIKTIVKNTGNVAVTPKIDVIILKDEQVIHSFSNQNTKIKPDTRGEIVTEWVPTPVNIPDDYIAKVTISLGDRLIFSRDLPFKILPIGTLSRQGNLTDIIIEGDPTIGSMVKLNAYFKNTGEIDTGAKFTGEVYKDGNLVDTIESDELQVMKKKEIVLVSYFKLESKGDYLIKGKVIYSGKETPVKEVSLKAGKSTPGFEGIYLIAVMLLFVMFRGKKKSRKM